MSFDFKTIYNELLNQLAENQIRLDEIVIKKLAEYLLLLSKWNRVHNLTRICKPTEMVLKHIIDSLSVGSCLMGPLLIDVGTGAGLPGVPLALAHPNYHFTLLDSNSKKTSFLSYVSQKLSLSNIDIISLRVEKYRPKICFNTVMCRAFSKLNIFLRSSQHLCCKNGIFLSMKGKYPHEELDTLSNQFRVIEIKPLKTTNLNRHRHALLIRLNKK